MFLSENTPIFKLCDLHAHIGNVLNLTNFGARFTKLCFCDQNCKTENYVVCGNQEDRILMSEPSGGSCDTQGSRDRHGSKCS